jgi:hypothetical protein
MNKMKKLVLSLIVLIFAGLNLNAQDATQPVPVNPNAPEIQFEKVVHDYGTVVQGGDGTCEFKFTNVGKEPLILSRPTSSCGCTVPTWPQEPVLPGKSEVIKVTYNTNNIGTINKTVTVNSNSKTARVVLQIKGTVTAKPATTLPEKPAETGASPVSK